jgi:hypothetical protein
LGDARRLVAKARERSTVLVALGPWPAEAAVRCEANGSRWRGLGDGEGLLAARDVDLSVLHRGTPVQARLRAG